MASKNTTNYNFLKNFRPELYKLAVKMEEDLLITPISILAYGTRFLEYILYDIAKDNNYKVNRESGFVNNIYELIQLDYLEYYLGDLMIKAYVFRNTSIHNTDITISLKDDKKTAHELNRRLFDIADVYYKNVTNNYEEHVYIEPTLINDEKKEISPITRQVKNFDKCIVCGESTKFSKSNFCQYHDNLLNYREVLTKIITSKGTDSLVKKTDFSYAFKDQLIKDLISLEVFQRIGNDFKINKQNLDDLFILTDKFMEIDEFLSEVCNGYIKNPEISKFYLSNEFPYAEVSKRIGEFYAGKMIDLMENEFSYEKALLNIGNKKHILNKWYDDKKSDFINGLNDELFEKYNELLIENLFKQLENNGQPTIGNDKIEFWSQYYEGFDDKLDEILSKKQLSSFMEMFKRNTSKKQVLNQINITEAELDNYMSKNDDAKRQFGEEIERRKRLMLVCIDDGLNFEEALEQSKLDINDYMKSREEFLDCDCNEFYDKLSQKLMRKYLNLRRIGKTTDEISQKLTIPKSEIETWHENELFKQFWYDYEKIRLVLLKQAANNHKSKEEILNELEMNDDEFKSFIKLGSDGDEKYIKFRQYFEEEYYPNMMGVFLQEFRKTLNVNVALKNTDLTKKDLERYLFPNEELYEEFIQIKIDKIVSAIINKGKYNDKLLKKLDISKKEFLEYEDEIEQKVIGKQMNFIIRELDNGEIMLPTCKKVNCDIDLAFEWIFEGTLGDEEFGELADVYWREHLMMIDRINSDLRDYNIDNPSRNKILTANMKYDFDYWMKWGLIGKDIDDLSMKEIKESLKEFEDNRLG